MNLYLVRHGASTGNTPGNLIGWSDHPLSAAGEAQARAVAARLAPLGPMPIYCSDLPRALATAQHIAAVWTSAGVTQRLSHAVKSDARLREVNIGKYEGSSWEDFVADTELNAALKADPFNTLVPDGESAALLSARVLAAVNEIVAATPNDMPDVCLVAHDGPIRAIINHYLGVPPEKWWTVSTAHGGLSLLEFTDSWISVRFVNDTSHLDGVDYKL